MKPRFLLAVFAVALLMGSCRTESTRIIMSPIVGPRGGSMLSIVRMSDEQGAAIVSPGEHTMFVHASGTREWSERSPSGPVRYPYRALRQQGDLFNYPREQFFAAHDGYLWLLLHPNPSESPRLLGSADRGASWREVVLPDPTLDEAKSFELAGGRPITMRASQPFRLYSSGTTLHLLSERDIWQLRLGDSLETISWDSVSVDGLPVAEAPTTGGYPAVLRNFLPRSRIRDFDLVTVLQDQLMIYRRASDDEPWVLTSTLAAVDRDLVGVHNADTVFIATPTAVYRSLDQGEQWFRFWPDDQPGIENIIAVPSDITDSGYGLIVGGTDGSLWHSLSAGAKWKMGRDPDPDGRTITGLTFTSKPTMVWASTMGEGVLRSSDVGRTWQAYNPGLHAARPLDIAVGQGGDLLLGTRVGFHKLKGGSPSEEWESLHPRGTSSVFVEPTSGRIVSGTLGGDVVLQTADQNPVEVPKPFAEGVNLDFHPPRLAQTQLGKFAVTSIAARDGGQSYVAWSATHGPSASSDGGMTWNPLAVGDALESALSNATVSGFLTDEGETIYLTESSKRGAGASQFWRSTDLGGSWSAVHAFGAMEQPVSLVLRGGGFPGVVFAAAGNVLARSADGGQTWDSLRGPWESLRIIRLAMHDDNLVMLAENGSVFEILVVTSLDAPIVETARYAVTWPPKLAPRGSEEIVDFEVDGGSFYLADRERIFIGRLPLGAQGLPEGVFTIFIALGLLIGTGVAFGLIKQSASA